MPRTKFKVLTFNNIPVAGLEVFPRDRYEVASEISNPDALLLRSYDIRPLEIPESLQAVGRAGVGVDNIPVEVMTARGIPVFNAPGANANAVKELVLAGMLLGARNICQAWEFSRGLRGPDSDLKTQVEAEKKRFKGIELEGKILGIIGLGAIGVRVANAAQALGMRVIGYDPSITVNNAWMLAAQTEQANTVGAVLQQADFVTLHVPLMDTTRGMINAERLQNAKSGSIILNFAREGIVDENALADALRDERLGGYICDFPSNVLKDHPRVVALPHLGASTAESEENCAIMVATQIREFLEHGNISNSVNFPEMSMAQSEGYRMLIVNSNVPHMIEGITKAIASADINIVDLLNKSRGGVACTLLDIESPPPESVLKQIENIQGVLAVHVL